jgi:hypothetical protein
MTDEEDDYWRHTPEGQGAVHQVWVALEKSGAEIPHLKKSAWPIGEYWRGKKVR